MTDYDDSKNQVFSFNLLDQDGNEFSFPEKDRAASVYLFYFYPKDDTPGCTKQACNFRNNLEKFQAKKVKVFGVSRDDVNSHKAFYDKYQLNFTLLSDPDQVLYKLCDIEGRDIVMLDDKGTLVKKYQGVSCDECVAECLKFLS